MATKIVTDGLCVYFQKFCPVHGNSQNLVHKDLSVYLETQHYVKPAWIPREFSGKSEKPCPQGCGFCKRHEQHLCLPIIEITSKCNLTCPICIADAGRKWEMSVEEFRIVIDGLIRAEKQVDVLNISGGEPLIHSRVLEIVDEALSRPEIVRVSLSTNGLALLQHSHLVHELYNRNVVVSLQFDGFDDNVYQALRGRKLLKQKMRILDLLAKTGISTSLTVTAASRINIAQLPKIVDYFFSQPHVVSMMIQPLSFAGRASKLTDQIERLSVADIIKLLDGTDNGRINASDFAPLPCSHPLCFSLAYYLVLDNGDTVSLNRLVDASTMLDSLANRTIFGLDSEEYDRLKDMVYEMWSGPSGSVPDSDTVMKTIRNILDDISSLNFDAQRAFTAAEKYIKSIFIHSFQDVETFDLSRARRCCQAYPLPDGRLMPVCVYNVLYRGASGSLAMKRGGSLLKTSEKGNK
ncbi:MAG: radical SAM protein [Gammaproteobacteria bacterium]|nr:radical SAM protein [Gammaproteobacteria bacterium]